jgi:hypothetical protein
MDESAVPARYKIRVRGVLSETLLGAFPGLHARRSSTCGSAADALMDEMSGSTMAEDRGRTAAPCG